jgi:hypothetical protein
MKPRYIEENDTKRWILPNGVLHREDGPGYETSDYKAFYINGKWHRENGPAIEYYNGGKEWWINDIQYTEQEYKIEMRSRKLKLLL